jgi:hypothetical protein
VKKFAPLPDLYFARRTQCVYTVTPIFISILESLSNRNSDIKIIVASLKELCYLESHLQIYALPSVISCLNDHPVLSEDAYRENLMEYFDGLVDFVPEEISDNISNLLVKLAYDGLDNKEGFDDMEKVASYINSLPEKEVPLKQGPYNDLFQYCTHTLLLQMLSFVCEDPFALMIFNENGNKNKNELKYFIINALQHRYGRLSFLSSLTVAVKLEIIDLSSVENYVWKNPDVSYCPELEPDLVYTYLSLSLTEKNNGFEAIESEFFGLKKFFQLVLHTDEIENSKIEMSNERKISIDENLSFASYTDTNIKEKEESRVHLAFRYWTGILCDLAVNEDPEKCANMLLDCWQNPTFKDEFQYCIKVPIANDEIRNGNRISKAFRKEVMFAKLITYQSKKKGLDVKIQIEHDSSVSDFSLAMVEPTLKQLIYSPWLEQRNGPKNKSGQVDYPNCLADCNRRVGNWVFLYSAVFVTQRILQQSEGNIVPQVYSNLLVHAASLLYRFRNYVNSFSRGEVPRNMSWVSIYKHKTMISIWVVLNQHVNFYMGSGLCEKINPWEWIGSDHKVAYPGPFFNSTKPLVMIDWVTTGYNSTIESNGINHWIENLPLFWEQYSEKFISGDHYNAYRDLLILMETYYPKSAQVPSLPWLSWELAGEKNNSWPIENGIDYKLLLLNNDLNPESWVKENWKEEYYPDEKKETILNYSVRSYWRYVSVVQNPEVKPIMNEKWRKEFIQLLYALDSNKDLNRFLKNKFVLFFDPADEYFAGYSDVHEIVMRLLFEFGTLNDISILDRFVWEKQPKSGIEFSDRLKQIRQDWRQLAINELEYSYENSLEKEKATNPLLSFSRSQIIGLYKKRIAWIAWQTHSVFGYFKDARTGRKNIVNHTKNRVFELAHEMVSVERKKSNLSFVLPSRLKFLTTSLFYNPGTGDGIAYHFRNDKRHGFINLFQASPAERQEVLSGQRPQRIVAFYIRSEDLGKAEPDSGLYEFDCGLPSRLTIKLKKYWISLKEGNFCTLTIRKTANDSWEIDPTGYIKVYDDWKPARLMEDRNSFNHISSKPPGLLWRQVAKGHDKGRIFWNEWYPDYSEIFGNRLPAESSGGLFDIDEDGYLHPLPGDLADLLLTIPIAKNLYSIVLKECFWNKEEHCMAYLIQTSFGKQFIINEYEWLLTEDLKEQSFLKAVEQFMRELEGTSRDDYSGLLFFAEPVYTNSGMQLTIKWDASELELAAIENLYPQTKLPFDARNILWRNLFQIPEGVYAGPRVAIKKIVPGFMKLVNTGPR